MAKAKKRKSRSSGKPLITARRALFVNLKQLPDDACLTLAEWAALNSLSYRIGRTILASGEGPTVTYLTKQRRAITVRHNREWQEKCAAR